MADEATEAPAVEEAAARIEATNEEQDQPTQHTEAPPEDGTSAGNEVEAPEYFAENFDPSTLPEELQPAYKQMQAAWTKKTQSLAEQRKEAENATAFLQALQSDDQRPQVLQQIAEAFGEEAVLEALGYDLADDEATDDDEDTDEELDPAERVAREWDEFKRQQAEAAQQAQHEAYLDSIDQALDSEFSALAEQHGEISDEEQEFLIGRALATPPPNGQQPTPEQIRAAVRDAYNALNGVFESRQQKWARTKETTQVAPGGKAATQVPDLDDPKAREDHLAEQIAKLEWDQ